MALKFRRGDASQKSGSLQFGEPYVNTTLNTLQVGGASGDITLATAIDSSATLTPGIVSASNFISTSFLHVTNDAEIKGNLTLGGNITIGNQSTDVVNVVANLSSSLIPSDDNVFDIGTTSKRYKDVYASQLSASRVTIESNNSPEIHLKNTGVNTEYHIRNANNGNFGIFNTLTNRPIVLALSASAAQTESIIMFADVFVSGNLSSNSEISGSSLNGIGNVTAYSASVENKIAALSVETSNLESFTSSINTTIKGQLDTNTVVSGSSQVIGILSSLNSYTSSNDTKWNTLGSLSESFARIDSANTFSGNQIISGSLTVTQDFVVLGSSSIQHISSSTLDIGTNLITVAVNQPSVRFGGLAVIDSGSANTSGSFLYDSVQDEFIFVHRGDGTNITSSHFVLGPETYNNLGNEIYLTNNKIPKGTGKEHLNDSNITDTGTLITIGSNTVIDGTLVATSITLISGSSQLTGDFDGRYETVGRGIISGSGQLTNYETVGRGIISGSGQLTNYETVGRGIISGSGQLTAYETVGRGIISGSGQLTAYETVGRGIISGSGQLTAYETVGRGIISGSSQITSLLPTGTVSGSSQVVLSNTNGFSTFSSSVDSRIAAEKARVDAILLAADADKDSFAEIVTLINSVDTTNDNAFASFFTASVGRLNNLESTTASLNISVSNLNSFTSSINTTIKNELNANTVVSGSSQISGLQNSQLTNSSITIAGTSVSLGGSITLGTITGGSGIISGSSQLTTDFDSRYLNTNGDSVVSGSSQISHDSTTGYSVNRHIDHSTVSITGTGGLTGGGDISQSRTISIAMNGVTNSMLANSSVTVAAGTGMSGGGNVSLGGTITLTNAGVTSNVAGSGISVSGATGAVTITNTGVRSIAAGTGVSVSATTGDSCTISIGQAVGTSSGVTFGSINVGSATGATSGQIRASGDIVAFASSDIRLKENIKPIENPIQKIRQISGNTYDWRTELKDVHGYEGNDVGVIAQEIEAVLPQLVTTRDNGYKAVKYDKLVALLIEGMKEQQLQIEQLRIDLNNCKTNKGL